MSLREREREGSDWCLSPKDAKISRPYVLLLVVGRGEKVWKSSFLASVAASPLFAGLLHTRPGEGVKNVVCMENYGWNGKIMCQAL